MKSIYVLGGQQKSPRSLFSDDPSWYEYKKGVILQVDYESGDVKTCIEYVSPLSARAEGDPVLFKAGTIQDDILYTCTQTEVLIYKLPHFKQIGYISLPCFNDLHHVIPTMGGNLLVANSGLEMVLEITLDGQAVRVWNVLGEDPWKRYSKDTDYRLGVNLKPHRAHPNYVFYVGEDIWVTRFEQKDAVCLTRSERRLDIGIERVHDGVVYEGLVYFTTVNGNLVIADPTKLQILEVLNLSRLHSEDTLLGWCRGLLLEKDKVWVGFSRIRPTKFREAVSWARLGFSRALPTHIACYDLVHRRCLIEIDLEDHGLNAVFSIFPALRNP